MTLFDSERDKPPVRLPLHGERLAVGRAVILEGESVARPFGDPAQEAPKARYRVYETVRSGSRPRIRSPEDDKEVEEHQRKCHPGEGRDPAKPDPEHVLHAAVDCRLRGHDVVSCTASCVAKSRRVGDQLHLSRLPAGSPKAQTENPTSPTLPSPSPQAAAARTASAGTRNRPSPSFRGRLRSDSPKRKSP